MTIVYLGNRQAVEHRPETDPAVLAAHDGDAPNRRVVMPAGKRCTQVHLPEGTPLVEALTTITHGSGVWAAHSDADAPVWVASDDATLAQVLAQHYGCELREPDPSHVPSGTVETSEG